MQHFQADQPDRIAAPAPARERIYDILKSALPFLDEIGIAAPPSDEAVGGHVGNASVKLTDEGAEVIWSIDLQKPPERIIIKPPAKPSN